MLLVHDFLGFRKTLMLSRKHRQVASSLKVLVRGFSKLFKETVGDRTWHVGYDSRETTVP